MADRPLFPVISHLPHTVVYNRIMPLTGEMYAHAVCRMHVSYRAAVEGEAVSLPDVRVDGDPCDPLSICVPRPAPRGRQPPRGRPCAHPWFLPLFVYFRPCQTPSAHSRGEKDASSPLQSDVGVDAPHTLYVCASLTVFSS